MLTVGLYDSSVVTICFRQGNKTVMNGAISSRPPLSPFRFCVCHLESIVNKCDGTSGRDLFLNHRK
jgi:hypothetical protein